MKKLYLSVKILLYAFNIFAILNLNAQNAPSEKTIDKNLTYQYPNSQYNSNFYNDFSTNINTHKFQPKTNTSFINNNDSLTLEWKQIYKSQLCYASEKAFDLVVDNAGCAIMANSKFIYPDRHDYRITKINS